MSMKDLLGCRQESGDVGVEIEVEANNIPDASDIPPFWRKEADGSLRGESAEFVLRRPLSLPGVQQALSDLSTCFTRNKMEFRPTYRAGIHVHVNVQELSPVQLVNFVCAYFMLEEVLLRYCDQSRIGNHFCLRMSDASYMLDRLVAFIQNEDLHLLNTEDLRYASLNVTSLFKYGSVESRALESTMDFSRIMVWATTLIRLRDYAMTLRSPVDLLGQASEMGFSRYAEVILGDQFPHFQQWATDDLVKIGVRNIQYAIYARNWETTNLNIFQAKNLFDGG